MPIQVDVPLVQDFLGDRASEAAQLIASALGDVQRLPVRFMEGRDLLVDEMRHLRAVGREVPAHRHRHHLLRQLGTHEVFDHLLEVCLHLVAFHPGHSVQNRDVVGERGALTVELLEVSGHSHAIHNGAHSTQDIGRGDPGYLGPNQLHLPLAAPGNYLAKLTRGGGRAVAQKQQIFAHKANEAQPNANHDGAPEHHGALEGEERGGPRPSHGGGHQVGAERIWLALFPVMVLGHHHPLLTLHCILHAVLIHHRFR
mmetsp:Transcript_94266/g.224441  ORF Transcript_94266/g.224441 Transcript_94266/m.224441 type:complete len:256 (-) Transcript_94266:631-1398(-)